jgi:subtilase family serine protease
MLAAAALPAATPQAPDFSRFAPGASTPARLIGRIDDQQRRILPADVPLAVRNRQPLGFVDASLPMESMILALKPSADAQARLDALSAAQQDPASPLFHRWLTPEQFGEMFGPSKEDMDAVVSWLLAQGFKVDEIAAGRLSITFSGSAAQVQRAFRTTIREFSLNGEIRHANAEAPSIPAALAPVVGGVVSLTDIPRKAMNTGFKPLPGNIHPEYTSGGGGHYLAAGDFATIYNLGPLYSAGIDGTGVTIGIVGRSNIKVSDVTTFRTFMGLPANNPTVVVNGTDPGTSDKGEESEALLDVEWSGAVAKKATVKFVTTKSTSSSDGVDLSASYIVNHQATLGVTVMSTSFGACESGLGSTENTFFNNLWQQAATEGITAFVSAGDSGASGCDSASASSGTGAAVSGLASTPYNVCVGGTEFLDGGGSATYWASTNGSDNSSALSYIPEETWNESGGTTDPAGGSGSGLWSTGGGVSTVYSKPSWQVAPGVPSDGKRDCPDVSLAAAGYTGYIINQSDNGGLGAVGGTSAASPSFAGLMALVVQKQGGAGQGNANPRFYQLGNAQYGSSGPAVFHDVTSGNNTVPGVTGFSAGTGYDLSTGLGTVDANALVNGWVGPSVSVTATTSTSVNVGGTVTFKATSSLTPNTVAWTATDGSFSPTSTAGNGTATTTYTAPGSIAGVTESVTVTGTGSDATTKGTATVTVFNPAAVTLSVSPDNTSANSARTLLAGKTLAFTGTTNYGTVAWSATGGAFNPTSTASGAGTTFTAPAAAGDVTVTAQSQGTASKTVTVHVKSMDINNDASVDVRDLLALMRAYTTYNAAADLNGDGVVNDADLTIFLANF